MNYVATAPIGEAESLALDELLITRRVPMALQRIRAVDPAAGNWHELLIRPAGADPGKTIGLAETARCADEVDLVVATHGLSLTRRIPGRISLNVSGQSVSDPSFLARFISAVDAAEFGYNRLSIEITETAPVTNFVAAGDFAASLRERGAWIVLDDVEDSATSLPIDLLDGVKVGKDMLADALRAGHTRIMLRSIVANARDHGLVVVAEGVEQQIHLTTAIALGFTHYQGFLHDLPVPLAG